MFGNYGANKGRMEEDYIFDWLILYCKKNRLMIIDGDDSWWWWWRYDDITRCWSHDLTIRRLATQSQSSLDNHGRIDGNFTSSSSSHLPTILWYITIQLYIHMYICARKIQRNTYIFKISSFLWEFSSICSCLMLVPSAGWLLFCMFLLQVVVPILSLSSRICIGSQNSWGEKRYHLLILYSSIANFKIYILFYYNIIYYNTMKNMLMLHSYGTSPLFIQIHIQKRTI